jgi:thioredoxin
MTASALTAENFDDTVTGNDIVVIDFWAPWCGPCRSFAPIFDKVAEENPDLAFVKVNTDEEQALAGHFGIRSIPTLMIFREQVIVFQQAGALPKGALDDILGQVRKLDMDEVRRGARPYEADDGDADGEDDADGQAPRTLQ